MPAKSQAQRGYLNARFGHAWVKAHHFDNKGPLPEHVGGGGKTMSHAKHDQGKPHMPYKTHGGKHAGGHHPSHAKHNKAHGLPADVFAHDGDGYSHGGAGKGFMGKGNC